MRAVKVFVLLLFLVQWVLAAQAQIPNSAQAPPAVNDQRESPAAPAVATPAGVTPVIPAPGVTQARPAGPAAPALAGQVRVRRVALMDIKGQPGFNGTVFVNGCVVMAHTANNSVDVFNVRKRRLVAQIPDMQGAGAMAVNPKASVIYVANSEGNNIAVISSQDWKLVRRIAVQDAPGGLLFVPEDNTLYSASYRQQTISLIDAIQGKQISRTAVDGSPEDMAFDGRRHRVYATLEAQNEVAVFDPGLKLLRRWKLNASEPTGVVYDRKTDRLYVAVRYAVLALDPETGSETARVAAPAGVDTLALDAAGQMLYAAAEGGSVQMIRTAGRLTVEQEVNTEVRGHLVAFDPESGMLFLPGGRDGRAKLLLLKQVSMGAPAAQQTAEK